MLRFVEFSGGDLRLTREGRRFANLDTDQRKSMFASRVLTFVPLAAHIRRILDERPDHTAPWSRFADGLGDFMSGADADQTLRTVVTWGRHAEIPAYDADTRLSNLETPQGQGRRR